MTVPAFTAPLPLVASRTLSPSLSSPFLPAHTAARPPAARRPMPVPMRARPAASRIGMVLLDDTAVNSSTDGGDALPARKPTKHDLATGRDPQRVKVFDTTLRDGEQSPGATLTADEKMVIARQLARLGVDVIEAGFPIASEGDFKAVQDIAKDVGNRDDPPIICGLARALKKDISRCHEAVKHAAFPRIHTFIATSDVHMAHKLRKTREEVLQIVTEMVTYATSLCEDVEFSAEDAIRSDPEFLCQVFKRAIEAGATTINVPDTVGYTTPAEFGSLVRYLRKNIEGLEDVTISVHGHDDLGMAVANFLSAVEGGARQVEVTINGIGERAGNASLEEVVMALHVRRTFYNNRLGRDEESEIPLTNIQQKEIYPTSRMVSNLTGMIVQPNKAIVGANAFAHESGIHQDGVLKHRQTYEIMDAQSIGLHDNSIVLGKHSGRHAFRARLKDMGFEVAEEELERSFIRFKELADKKKEVSEADIESLVSDEVRLVQSAAVHLRRIQVQCGDHCLPTATISISLFENEFEQTATSTGTGPVDAAYCAINKLVDNILNVTLVEYKVSSVTRGIDALGEVSVKVIDGETGRYYTGSSANTDVVVASAHAYVNAVNRCQVLKDTPEKIHPQFGRS